MTDLALLFSEHGDFDLMVEAGDLLGDEGLTTAITISLFTDRLARQDDPLPEHLPGQVSDRRGYWGSLARRPNLDDANEIIGSRLWLLHREKELQAVVHRAQDYAGEGLAWLPALGGAVQLEVTAPGHGRLQIDVEARDNGPNRRTQRWTAFLDYNEKRVVELKGAR